jgi:hypothetical protein
LHDWRLLLNDLLRTSWDLNQLASNHALLTHDRDLLRLLLLSNRNGHDLLLLSLRLRRLNRRQLA